MNETQTTPASHVAETPTARGLSFSRHNTNPGRALRPGSLGVP